MSTQMLEQTRAEFAYKCVEQIANDGNDVFSKKKFKGLVKKAPTYILTNGLGNTIAFLFSKGKNEHLALAYILGKYLFNKNQYTKNIFQADELFGEEEKNFFDYLKDLYELDKIKKNYLKAKNKGNEPQKIKWESSFKENFNDFKSRARSKYSKFVDIKLENIDIENFDLTLFINPLKNKIQSSLFREIIFINTDKYILATEETLRLLNWLKRFVEAMIEGEE